MASRPGVEVKGLKKTFGAVTVIPGIDLTIDDGEFIALVGPSGCGKSTLLRIVAGLEDASEGDVFIGGNLVNDVSPRDRNIAMVFQNYALYPHMTVADNMSFSLKLARRTRPEIEAAVTRAATMLDLTDYLERLPAQLSGGQRQRVAMGRALVRDPSVFLFDEPLSNLDAKLRVQMRMEIKTLHQQVGKTSIYVTHDQIEAMTLADRIVVLNKGRIEQQGTPLELYQQPDNLFVAGFIGSPNMNFINATAAGDKAMLPDGTALRLAGSLAASVGTPIVIGIRPEHLLHGANGTALGGMTSLIEPTGAQTLVTFRLGEVAVTALVSGEDSVRLGTQFSVAVAPQHVYAFDATSGKRLATT